MLVAAVVAGVVVGVTPAVVEGGAADVVELVAGWGPGLDSEGGSGGNIALALGSAGGAVVVIPKVAELFSVPKAANGEAPDWAAAGVDDGVVDKVAPPRLGKGGFWGVVVDVDWAVNDGWELAVRFSGSPREDFEADFELGVVEGNANAAIVCAFEAAPAKADGVEPNRAFEPPSEVAGTFCSDSCGLSLLRGPPNNAPPPSAGSAKLITGLDAPLCSEPPVGFNWKGDGAADVADAAAVVDGMLMVADVFCNPNVGFCVPGAKNPDCPWLVELLGGGGPAGVVDTKLNKLPPPDGAGVDVLAPRTLFGASPEAPVVVVWPGTGASVALLGVCRLNKDFPSAAAVFWFCNPKLRDGVLVALPVPVFPNTALLSPRLSVAPNGDDVELPVVDAPTLPKRPPPDPPADVFGCDPNRLLVEPKRLPSLDVGALNLNELDMAASITDASLRYAVSVTAICNRWKANLTASSNYAKSELRQL
jgi:hypothetical protein